MGAVSVKTYAKVNLSLDVIRKRSDGYHDVKMVMHQVELYDELTIELKISNIPEISLKCNKRSVPEDERNLAYKAAKLYIEKYGNIGYSVEINITKNIPVAAGLAGGSSNAAGTILALDHLLGIGSTLNEMMEIGVRLGADVPFCILGQAALNRHLGVKGGAVCALAEGIGEVLTPMPPIDAWVLLSKPSLEVSTALVYGSLKADMIKDHPDTEELLQALCRKDLKKIQANMANMLETVALTKYPNIIKTLDLMAQNNKYRAIMSGSGPTIFSLFSEFDEGRKLFEVMKQVNEETYLVKTCNDDISCDVQTK